MYTSLGFHGQIHVLMLLGALAVNLKLSRSIGLLHLKYLDRLMEGMFKSSVHDEFLLYTWGTWSCVVLDFSCKDEQVCWVGTRTCERW